MPDGIYCHRDNNFIWDNEKFNEIANHWIKEWEDKIDERELAEVVSRATSDRRDTFRIA